MPASATSSFVAHFVVIGFVQVDAGIPKMCILAFSVPFSAVVLCINNFFKRY